MLWGSRISPALMPVPCHQVVPARAFCSPHERGQQQQQKQSVCTGGNPVSAVAVSDNFIADCSAVGILLFPLGSSFYIRSGFLQYRGWIHNWAKPAVPRSSHRSACAPSLLHPGLVQPKLLLCLHLAKLQGHQTLQ